jgi:hypothetical protein
MKNILPKLSLLFLGLIFFCQSKNESSGEVEQNDVFTAFKIDFDAIASIIVDRAALQNGERVILVGKPGDFDSLILLLKAKIESSGAAYLGTISVAGESPKSWQTTFTSGLSPERNLLAKQLTDVDLGIMLPGADTTHVPYAAMQDVLRTGNGRTIHFHWAGAYHMDGSVAMGSQMVDELYQTALLQTDYQKLSEHQQQFEDAVRLNSIKVTTPLGTDLRFSVGNRPVTKQDGDASRSRSNKARNLIDREVELPAGAVRVAPLEETVQGTIAFPSTEWDGVIVKDLTMEFSNGKIVNIDATEGLDQVKAELEKAGPGAFFFRELAVGFNPWLAIPEIGRQWIPYYGYGAGVIRLSLGDNTELGGRVTGSYVRWNFFTNATLEVGSDTWIRDGRMVHRLE